MRVYNQIPFDQLKLGKIIAQGGQGQVCSGATAHARLFFWHTCASMQVRLGDFAGVPVAIKELLSAMWDPKCTEVSHNASPWPEVLQFLSTSLLRAPIRSPSIPVCVVLIHRARGAASAITKGAHGWLRRVCMQ